jgi:uncharacterized protein
MKKIQGAAVTRIAPQCISLAVLLGLSLGSANRGPAATTPTAFSQGRPVSHYDEARLSPPRYQVRFEHNVRVPMRDGVELSADIYRPDAGEKFATILVRTPYSNNSASAINQGHYQSVFYAERGYVVVQQDVRGRYDSDGAFYPFRNEPNDGFDTDEWIGQQPWSNGRIGTIGQSYFGITQLLQAIKGSGYLKTAIPNVTSFDTYNNWIYKDGAFQLGFALPWAVFLDGRVNQELTLYDWRSAFRHLPILEADEATGRRIGFYRDWVRHSARDSYWDENSWETAQDHVGIPILNITGWYDIFLAGLLNDHVAITKRGKTESARKAKRVMIGPWVHGIGRNPVGDVDFGPEATVDLARVQLRWLDHWLKDVGNGVDEEPSLRIFIMGENRWRDEREWPLARTRYTNYYFQSNGRANSLNGDGELSAAPPKSDRVAKDTYTYDPADPVPTLGGNNCCWTDIVPMGPFDQRAAERRDDVLVFTSSQLTEPLEITGPIIVRLFASTTARDTDFTAKLVDVHPNGFAQNLQDGIIRARNRVAGKPAQLIEPGKVYEYTIDLWATSNVFLPGHRIRVEVASSNFPRFDRNLNTGDVAATGTQVARATQTIYHDPDRPSHIVLPVIPRSASSSAASVASGTR